MVESQLRARGISDAKVLDAFRQIPRELFIPPHRVHEAYADRPVPIGHGQTISQPLVVAMMLQELDIRPHHRVLDVGAGSGFQTAIIARLARRVYAIERIGELAEQAMGVLAALNVNNVSFYTGDGSLGWPEEAPFDRIVCGAGAPDVPAPWLDQLADDGRIAMPVGGLDCQTLVIVEKTGHQIRKRKVCDVRFVKLVGQHGWPT